MGFISGQVKCRTRLNDFIQAYRVNQTNKIEVQFCDSFSIKDIGYYREEIENLGLFITLY